MQPDERMRAAETLRQGGDGAREEPAALLELALRLKDRSEKAFAVGRLPVTGRQHPAGHLGRGARMPLGGVELAGFDREIGQAGERADAVRMILGKELRQPVRGAGELATSGVEATGETIDGCPPRQDPEAERMVLRENTLGDGRCFVDPATGAGDVHSRGKLVGRVIPGQLIGEATVLGEAAAIATVSVTEPARIWCAQGRSLNAYLAANPDARHALEHSFTVSLREKLDAMNRAAGPEGTAA